MASTVRDASSDATTLAVKGGAWNSERTECRTEYRKESRDAALGYDDVGFRVIQVRGGIGPEHAVELSALDAPTPLAISASPTSVRLIWQETDGAIAYQVFEYFEDTGLLKMLDTVERTTTTIDNLEPGSTHRYIVQPISYVAVADNVSGQNSMRVTCGGDDLTTLFPLIVALPLYMNGAETVVG